MTEERGNLLTCRKAVDYYPSLIHGTLRQVSNGSRESSICYHRWFDYDRAGPHGLVSWGGSVCTGTGTGSYRNGILNGCCCCSSGPLAYGDTFKKHGDNRGDSDGDTYVTSIVTIIVTIVTSSVTSIVTITFAVTNPNAASLASSVKSGD